MMWQAYLQCTDVQPPVKNFFQQFRLTSTPLPNFLGGGGRPPPIALLFQTFFIQEYNKLATSNGTKLANIIRINNIEAQTFDEILQGYDMFRSNSPTFWDKLEMAEFFSNMCEGNKLQGGAKKRFLRFFGDFFEIFLK